MSKSDYLENAILDLLLNGTGIPNIADNASVSPLNVLYIGLCTASPGEAGDQSTSEVGYSGYSRVAVARTPGGWTITGSSANPTANIDFPQSGDGPVSATHFSIGTDASGAGNLLWKGSITPPISISAGVTPRLGTGTTLTED